jgi:hypothetical protein
VQPSPSLDDLGALVRQRRESLRLGRRKAAATAAMSPQTWNNVEDGKNANRLTYAGVESALRWPSGSITAYLERGEAPESLPEPQTPDEGEHGPPIGLASYDRILEELRHRHATMRDELARVLAQAYAPSPTLDDQRPHLAEAEAVDTAESVQARGGIPGLPLNEGGSGDAAQGGQA